MQTDLTHGAGMRHANSSGPARYRKRRHEDADDEDPGECEDHDVDYVEKKS